MSAKQKKNAVTGQGRGFGKYIQHNWQLWVMLFPAMLYILIFCYVPVSYTHLVPLAYGIAWMTRTPELPNGRNECVFISLLCSWVLGAVMTYFFYRKGAWKKKALES